MRSTLRAIALSTALALPAALPFAAARTRLREGRAGQLRRPRRKAAAGGGQHLLLHHDRGAERARPAAGDAAIPARLAVREVLPRLHEPQSPRRRARRGAAADAEPRLGLHRRSVGHHRHQQPRDRRRRQDHRHAAGQHQPDRDAARQGRQGRSRGAEGERRQAAAGGRVGRFRPRAASATGCSRSATRSASAARSRPGS